MGPLPTRGGVRAKGTGRVQFDFNFHGTRYRPTIAAEPTEANLQRARAKLRRIKSEIAGGSFSFAKELPNYRYRQRLARSFISQTCNDVFDSYLAHCEARLTKLDLAYATRRELPPRHRLDLAPDDRHTALRSGELLDAREDRGCKARRQEDVQQHRECLATRVRVRLSRPSGAAQSRSWSQDFAHPQEGSTAR